MLEDLNSNMKLLAEGHKDLKEGQTGIIARLDRVEVKVDGIDVRVIRLEMKTDVMVKELSGQRAEINSQGVALRGQTADIKEIKNILLSHDKRLANLEPTRA